MQTSSSPRPSDLLHRKDVTERYAKFARDASGLGSVFGGVLLIVTWAVGALASLDGVVRVFFALPPIAYVIVNQSFKSKYYQRFGRVTASLSTSQRYWHFSYVAFMAIVGIVVGAAIVTQPIAGASPSELMQRGAYAAFVLAHPIVVARYLWTAEEKVVGTALFCEAAVTLGGQHYGVDIMALVFVGFGGAAILKGLAQHRDFRKLRAQLEALQEAI
jgi:hypothetical protein